MLTLVPSLAVVTWGAEVRGRGASSLARRAGILPLLLGLAVLAVARTGGANEPVGHSLKGMPLASLEIHGLPRALGDELRAGLALQGRRRLLRTDRPLLFPEILEEDLARARLFLAREGYPEAVVDWEAVPTEGGRAVRLRLNVRPGAAVRVQTVRVTGLPSDVAPDDLGVRTGDVFRDAATREAAALLTDRLLEAGYAMAQVTPSVANAGPRGVDVELAVAAGPHYRIGDVHVDGVAPDLGALARETLGLHAGRPYSPGELATAEANLRELDLFRQVRLVTEPMDGNRLRVNCLLSESLPRSLTLGVGYFSDEQLRGEASWRHRNLFRGGRGLRLAGTASRFLQTVRADVVWPRPFGVRVRALGGLSARRENEEAYELLDLRGDLQLKRRVGRVTSIGTGVVVARIDVRVRTADPVLEDPEGIVTSVPLWWSRDTSDDPVSPRAGSVARVDLEVTPPGLGSVTHYARGELRVAGYRGAPGVTVLAGRALVGAARPLQDTAHVLASRRLFAGGARSMRGFGRRRLGPRDADGEPVGGEAKLEASIEWRFPVLGRIEGAVFLDAGQVWATPAQARLDDLEWAAGPALMVRTPVGPLRLDAASLLQSVPGEPRSVLHFSVGHPY